MAGHGSKSLRTADARRCAAQSAAVSVTRRRRRGFRRGAPRPTLEVPPLVDQRVEHLHALGLRAGERPQARKPDLP